MRPTVLGVVTARAGSKGLPGKNTRPLAGQPLIAHTIDAARASGALDRLVLSSDDEQAIAIATARGCEVPFVRPAALAGDDTIHLDVMIHAAAWLRDRERYEPEWTMILMPTSPLRQPQHIVEAIELAVRTQADSVVSVDEMPSHYNPMRAIAIDDGGLATLFVGGRPVRTRPNRRQDMPPAWVLNGAIYLFRTRLLFEPEPTLYGDRVVAYVMPPPYGLNIDDADDWERAERLLSR
jgi:CMP-N-acetylneuraminic acid synthetase